MKLKNILSKKTVCESIELRAIVFLLVLLLVLPIAMSFFVSGFNADAQTRTVFLLQKLYLFVTLCVILLVFLVRQKKMKTTCPNQKNVLFLIAAILFFVFAFSTQLDLNKNLAEGASFTVTKDGAFLNIDSERFFAVPVLGDSIPMASFLLEKDNDFSLKKIYLNETPKKNLELKMLAVVIAKNNSDFNSTVKMIVNKNEIDISGQFKSLKKGKTDWLTVTVPREFLQKGQNTVSIVLERAGNEKIGIYSQATYFNNNSSLVVDGVQKNIASEYHEFVLFANEPNELLFSALFKFGFVLRLLAIVLLFFAVFGKDFVLLLAKKARKEFAFSTVFAFFVYWFGSFLQGYWKFFSFIVTKSVYYILKILMLNPVIDLRDLALPRVGAKGFVVAITDTCSGVESMGYFLLAYTALIVFNWQDIDLKKAVILYIPGLIGIFSVNILRVTLILLVGLFYDKQFALNTFHTNAAMLFFILYFLIFWPVAMKIIQKK